MFQGINFYNKTNKALVKQNAPGVIRPQYTYLQNDKGLDQYSWHNCVKYGNNIKPISPM
jgi:hypothetical protein